MKNRNILFLLIFTFLFVIPNAYAYQSLWDKTNESTATENEIISIKKGLTNGSDSQSDRSDIEIVQKTQPISLLNNMPDTRTDTTISVDSVQYFGNTNENPTPIVNTLTGLTLLFSSQTGDTPIQAVELSKDNTVILSYIGQITEPYLVNSNLLGKDTYLIHRNDQFEEKIASSIYTILEQMTDNSANLPDLESVNTMIQAFRESSNTGAFISTGTDISQTQELDLSAFEIPMLSAIMKLHETSPSSEISYLFTDFPSFKREYTWPEISSLPSYGKIAASISGTFTAEDILLFVNAFPQFFADNPEFAALMNEQIRAGLIRSNPELAARENTDYLAEIIYGLQETVQTEMQNKQYPITIDQDENGNLLRFTIESVVNDDPQSESLIFTYQKTNNEISSVFELSLDSVNRNGSQPICRTLGIKDEGIEPQLKSINFRFDDDEDLQFEFIYSADHSETSEIKKVSDITLEFDWKGQKGNAEIKTNLIPNQFGSEDSSSQISYTHITNDKPVFSIDISSETKTNEPIYIFEAVNAIPASQLNQEDYDQIASQIFLQIMMLVMNMM